jgi:predicted transcriptional regulator
MGESCVPNLMLLPFADLLQWCNKRQNYLGWTNKKLAEKSKVPDGTISRIKAGEDDCKYSTIRNILIALIGGTTDEFSCTEQVQKELRQMEQLEQQAEKMSTVEKENEELRQRIEEYRELTAFLKDELKAWRNLHQSK